MGLLIEWALVWPRRYFSLQAIKAFSCPGAYVALYRRWIYRYRGPSAAFAREIVRSMIKDRSMLVRQGLAIAAVLLWIAALVARQWLVPSFARPNQIHVDEATYGESCEHFVPPSGNINRVRRGNATVVALQACNNTDVFCPIYIDRVKFGDPAAGCEKDFNVSWRCGKDRELRHLNIPGEAVQQLAWLNCSDHEP